MQMTNQIYFTQKCNKLPEYYKQKQIKIHISQQK